MADWCYWGPARLAEQRSSPLHIAGTLFPPHDEPFGVDLEMLCVMLDREQIVQDLFGGRPD